MITRLLSPAPSAARTTATMAAAQQAMTTVRARRRRGWITPPEGTERGSAEDELGRLADLLDAAAHQQRVDARFAPGLEVVADLVRWADQRELFGAFGGDGGGR